MMAQDASSSTVAVSAPLSFSKEPLSSAFAICDSSHCTRLTRFLKMKLGGAARGWGRDLRERERERKKGKIYIWNACQVNHDFTSRFCCYRCATLLNYNRYSCVGAFFDLIEWLKVWFTPAAGSIFRPLSQTQNLRISPDFSLFSSNPSNFVGKVFLCGRTWPQLQLRNLNPWIWFQKLLFWKRVCEKDFLSNVLIRG